MQATIAHHLDHHHAITSPERGDVYLIWSSTRLAWATAGYHGYTKQIIHAGLFTKAAALTICQQINFAAGATHEIPVQAQDSLNITTEAGDVASMIDTDDQRDGENCF